jgi:hypothetical protein
MATGVVTSAKTKLYVAGIHASATDTASEFDALTWHEVGDVVSFGEFGASFEEITHQPVSDGNTYKFKGTRNDGTLALNLGRAPADTGQALLITALSSYKDYDFRVELNDAPDALTGAKGTRMFFAGKVMSYTTAIPSANSIVGATCNISINGQILEAAPVAGTP